jgi:ribosome recycling factor
MVVGVLGGITYLYMNKPVTYTQEIIIPQVKEEEPKEVSAEDQHFAELMKIKEQEARLEAKVQVKKEEFDVKDAEYTAKIAELQKEYDSYVATAEADIKASQAELASFIKATSLSKD